MDPYDGLRDTVAKVGGKYDGAIAEAAAQMECVKQYNNKYGLR
jgi:hypothetical protein